MEQLPGSKLGKEYDKAVYCLPAYLTYMQNAVLDEAQVGIKIAWRNISNPRYADDTTLRVESEEELKSLLTRVKEKSKKVGLLRVKNTQHSKNEDHGIWSHHFMANRRESGSSDRLSFLGLQNHHRQ